MILLNEKMDSIKSRKCFAHMCDISSKIFREHVPCFIPISCCETTQIYVSNRDKQPEVDHLYEVDFKSYLNIKYVMKRKGNFTSRVIQSRYIYIQFIFLVYLIQEFWYDNKSQSTLTQWNQASVAIIKFIDIKNLNCIFRSFNTFLVCYIVFAKRKNCLRNYFTLPK